MSLCYGTFPLVVSSSAGDVLPTAQRERVSFFQGEVLTLSADPGAGVLTIEEQEEPCFVTFATDEESDACLTFTELGDHLITVQLQVGDQLRSFCLLCDVLKCPVEILQKPFRGKELEAVTVQSEGPHAGRFLLGHGAAVARVPGKTLEKSMYELPTEKEREVGPHRLKTALNIPGKGEHFDAKESRMTPESYLLTDIKQGSKTELVDGQPFTSRAFRVESHAMGNKAAPERANLVSLAICFKTDAGVFNMKFYVQRKTGARKRKQEEDETVASKRQKEPLSDEDFLDLLTDVQPEERREFVKLYHELRAKRSKT